jgi:serine/threonine protein kinase
MTSQSAEPDPPGLFDRFEVLGSLGEGGMGKVSLAYDRRLRARVALKAVGSVTGKALLRFKHEFRSVKGLAHPNLVSLGELFEQDSRWYLSMEYVDGTTFLDHVRPCIDERAESGSMMRPRPRVRNRRTRDVASNSDNVSVTRSGAPVGTHSEPSGVIDLGGDTTGVDKPEELESGELSLDDATRVGVDSSSRPAGSSSRPGYRADSEVSDVGAETIGDTVTSLVDDAELGDSSRSGGNGGPAFEEGRLRHSLLQLVDATYTLHQSGRVHRDLKPSNVLVTPAGRVVILDFGLIAELHDERSQSEGAVLGTPAYMAPEQASGLPAGPPADWYAVGVMLYEALCGRWPVTGSSLTIMADKQVAEPPRPSEVTTQPIPPDLERLCLDLLAVDPADRPDGAEIFNRLGAGGRSESSAEGSSSTWLRELPCVGREPELARIAAMFEQTRAKQPRQLLVLGESGMGKSALVREALGRFSAQLATRPWILRGRCYEHEQVRFKAFDALIDQLTLELPERFAHAELRELLPRHAWLLCRAFPVLQRIKAFAELGVRHGSWQHRGALQRQMFEAFRELFARLAERSHLVVVVEDLQWADLGSWSLLAALTSGADAPPLGLLATARTELDSSRPEDRADKSAPEAALPFLGSPQLERITLGPLAHADVAKLAELHGRPLGDDSTLSQTLFDAADGHPFFLDVLLRSNATFEAGKVPSLGECLWTELQQLGPSESAALRVLAIADRPLDPPELGSLAALDSSQLGRAIDRLRALQWIRSGSGADAGRIEVFHDQIRQTLLARLAQADARTTHLAIARMLEQRGDEIDRLVSHLLAAGEEAEAARWATEAAEQAMDAMAFERAVELYALALRHPPSEAGDHHRLQIAHAHALAWTGRGIEAAQGYLAAERDAERSAGLELRTKAAIHLLSAGQLEAGFQLIEQLGAELGLAVPRSSTTTILHLIRERTMLRLRGFRAPTRTVELRFEEKLRLELCSAAARVYTVHDMFLASYFTTTYVRLALRSEDRANVAIALSLEGVTRSYLGQPSKAEELLDAADGLLDGIEDPFALGSVAMHRAVHLGLAANDCEAYRDAVSRALRQLRRSGRAERGDDLGVALRAINTSLGLLMRGIASSRAGDYRALEGQLREYLDDARARDDRTALIHAYVSPDFGMAHMIRGRPDIPGETIQQGLALINGDGFSMGHLSALLSQVRCAIYLGRPEQAVAAVEAVRGPMRASTTVRAPDARAEAAVAEAAAFVAMRAHTNDPKMRRIAQKPIKFLLEYPGAYHRGRGEAFLAALRGLDGDRDGARASLEQALASLEGCRANGYAAAVRLALATLTEDKDLAREHRTAGLRFFLEAEVKEPERLAEMLTPGFGLARGA